MHRKQFQAIADVLLAARKEWGNSPTNAEHVIYDIESKLAILFKSENNLFDRSRFERASRPANWTPALWDWKNPHPNTKETRNA